MSIAAGKGFVIGVDILVIGGGTAGNVAALKAKEALPEGDVLLLGPSRGRFHSGRGVSYGSNLVQMLISEIGLCSGRMAPSGVSINARGENDGAGLVRRGGHVVPHGYMLGAFTFASRWRDRLDSPEIGRCEVVCPPQRKKGHRRYDETLQLQLGQVAQDVWRRLVLPRVRGGLTDKRHNCKNSLSDPMSITLDDEQTQQIFLTLVESLEGGKRLPTKLLVTYLQHPEDAIRRLAIEVIEYGNDPAAIPALLRAAADPDIEISVAAGEALRSFRNLAATKHLIEGLEYPASETRLAAVVALRERNEPEAVNALLRTISDPVPEVRREVVIALACYRDDELVPALRSALRDKSAAVRKAAVAAVANFDGSLVFLILALTDDSWQVRREAAIALGRFPCDGAVAALRNTLGDPAWQVEREAVLSLSRLQASDDERVARLLFHELADLRAAAASALGESLNPAWIARLELLLNDPDAGVEKSARRAIERLASSKHQMAWAF
jgi:HEAT repeat protein